MKRILDEEQAYRAMFYFLEHLFEEGFDELGGLLGSMNLLEDKTPADPSLWSDWEDAIKKSMLKND